MPTWPNYSMKAVSYTSILRWFHLLTGLKSIKSELLGGGKSTIGLKEITLTSAKMIWDSECSSKRKMRMKTSRISLNLMNEKWLVWTRRLVNPKVTNFSRTALMRHPSMKRTLIITKRTSSTKKTSSCIEECCRSSEATTSRRSLTWMSAH